MFRRGHKAIDKVEPGARLWGVEGHQPQHPRSFRVLRLVFDTAALREDDFVNGLVEVTSRPGCVGPVAS